MNVTQTPSPFRFLGGHVNPFTGKITYFPESVEIHDEDVSWLVDLWDESDRIDYEIWRAGCSTG